MTNSKKKNTNIRQLLFLAALALVLIFFYKYQQNWVLFLGDDNTKLENEKMNLKKENDIIMTKINSIMALEKLDKLAKDKNFTPPQKDQIINIDMQNYEEKE
ncbi:hypothetical protein [Candidatus Ruminimicrobium bovinum]|uniref:hypothetical protein n=1 Tax=Candidatus Ruminimicrobium bovinum TaxID=3242779 RepID=UPI0039B8C5D0